MITSSQLLTSSKNPPFPDPVNLQQHTHESIKTVKWKCALVQTYKLTSLLFWATSNGKLKQLNFLIRRLQVHGYLQIQETLPLATHTPDQTLKHNISYQFLWVSQELYMNDLALRGRYSWVGNWMSLPVSPAQHTKLSGNAPNHTYENPNIVRHFGLHQMTKWTNSMFKLLITGSRLLTSSRNPFPLSQLANTHTPRLKHNISYKFLWVAWEL